jgi:excinuclease ABC subunit C
MDAAPLRIECIDVSHVQGTDVVASLVVFEDGLPKRSDYRRFAIREHPGDDVASIAEVVRRRFTHPGGAAPQGAPGSAVDATGGAVDARGGTVDAGRIGPLPGINPETGRPRRFAYPPQLLVVDGGAPQVNAASAVLTDLGIADITVCGLAKRLEEVWLPGQDEPVIFPRTSEALYLMQRLRDEAHRFAITYHRAKRSKSMIVSALDGIPGLGRTRRTALVKHFGSVAALRRADAVGIAAVPGIGPATAAAVYTALHVDETPAETTDSVPAIASP